MPLLGAIRHVQAAMACSIEDAAAVVLAALQSGAVPARRSGPENAMPLDGRYERWNGELAPQAWHLATIHDDGTVSFDTSEGSPLLRRALQHAIQVRHEIEVGRDAVLRSFNAAAGNSELPAGAAVASPLPPLGIRTNRDEEAEKECERWISDQSSRPKNKQSAFEAARKACGEQLSYKAFERAWANKAPVEWKKSGRRKRAEI